MASSHLWLKIFFYKRLTFFLVGVCRNEKPFGSGVNNQHKQILLMKIAWKNIVYILLRSLKNYWSLLLVKDFFSSKLSQHIFILFYKLYICATVLTLYI